MKNAKVNYDELAAKLLKKSYRLADVRDQLETVAFDVVRFKDSDMGADLWQIQSADDGEFIVTKYEDAENVKTAGQSKFASASANPWQVILSKVGKTLNFFYKGDPIVRVASKTLGIDESELTSVERYLPKKLAENKKLVSALLSELPQSAKDEVLGKYPELL
jgi:hypothetical protein